MVLSSERDGANGAFDGVGVELDAAVIEEAAKSIPAAQGIASGIGEPATRRDLASPSRRHDQGIGESRDRGRLTDLSAADSLQWRR